MESLVWWRTRTKFVSASNRFNINIISLLHYAVQEYEDFATEKEFDLSENELRYVGVMLSQQEIPDHLTDIEEGEEKQMAALSW